MWWKGYRPRVRPHGGSPKVPCGKKKERQDCGHQCLMGASRAITIQLRDIFVLLIFAGFLLIMIVLVLGVVAVCTSCPPMLTAIGFYLPAHVPS